MNSLVSVAGTPDVVAAAEVVSTLVALAAEELDADTDTERVEDAADEEASDEDTTEDAAEDDAADEVVKVDDATLLGTVESETVSVRETEEDAMLLEAAAEES